MLATFASKLGPLEKKMSLSLSQIEDKSCQYRAITRDFVYSLKMKKKKVIQNVQIKFRRVSRPYCLLLGIPTVATASKNDTINISAYNFTVMVFTSSLFCCCCLIKNRQNLTAIACIGSFHWLSVPWATNSTDS